MAPTPSQNLRSSLSGDRIQEEPILENPIVHFWWLVAAYMFLERAVSKVFAKVNPPRNLANVVGTVRITCSCRLVSPNW